MTVILPIPPLEDVRAVGQRLWFEYHCWESDKSGDAPLWYRSQQQVEVLGAADCDCARVSDVAEARSRAARCDAGLPLLYVVRFDDGHVGTVFEDELLDDRSEFSRPAPPRGPAGREKQ